VSLRCALYTIWLSTDGSFYLSSQDHSPPPLETKIKTYLITLTTNKNKKLINNIKIRAQLERELIFLH